MSFYSGSIQLSNAANNTAAYNRMVLAVYNLLLSSSWVPVVVSGSTDQNSPFGPTSITTTAFGRDYNVWQINDFLSGSAPLYVKLEYGFNTNAAQFAIAISVGPRLLPSGTYHVGYLNEYARAFNINNNVATTASGTISIYGTSGSFALQFFTDAGITGIGGVVGVERTLDEFGNPTPEGAYLFGLGFNSSTTAGGNQVMLRSFGAGPFSNSLRHIHPKISTTLRNGEISVSPVFLTAGKVYPPTRLLLVGSSTEFGAASQTTIVHYNTSSVYYGIPQTTTPLYFTGLRLLVKQT